MPEGKLYICSVVVPARPHSVLPKPNWNLYIRSVVVPARLGQPQYEIENPTLEVFFAALPPLRDPIEEENQTVLTADILAFLSRLREAARVYRERHHRKGAIAAVDAVINLIERFDLGLHEHLAVSFGSLKSALAALEFGTVDPLVEPNRDGKGGNTPNSMERQDLIGTAVGTVKRLQWTGLPLKQAHKMVADTLNKIGGSYWVPG